MSNVTPLPTAAAAPVINRWRGRLPATVAKLAPTRPTTALAVDHAGGAQQTYSARRLAAVALVTQGPDADLFKRLDQLRSALMDIDTQIWNATNALLFRADPGLEDAGKAKGGQS